MKQVPERIWRRDPLYACALALMPLLPDWISFTHDGCYASFEFNPAKTGITFHATNVINECGVIVRAAQSDKLSPTELSSLLDTTGEAVLRLVAAWQQALGEHDTRLCELLNAHKIECIRASDIIAQHQRSPIKPIGIMMRAPQIRAERFFMRAPEGVFATFLGVIGLELTTDDQRNILYDKDPWSKLILGLRADNPEKNASFIRQLNRMKVAVDRHEQGVRMMYCLENGQACQRDFARFVVNALWSTDSEGNTIDPFQATIEQIGIPSGARVPRKLCTAQDGKRQHE